MKNCNPLKTNKSNEGYINTQTNKNKAGNSCYYSVQTLLSSRQKQLFDGRMVENKGKLILIHEKNTKKYLKQINKHKGIYN